MEPPSTGLCRLNPRSTIGQIPRSCFTFEIKTRSIFHFQTSSRISSPFSSRSRESHVLLAPISVIPVVPCFAKVTKLSPGCFCSSFNSFRASWPDGSERFSPFRNVTRRQTNGTSNLHLYSANSAASLTVTWAFADSSLSAYESRNFSKVHLPRCWAHPEAFFHQSRVKK